MVRRAYFISPVIDMEGMIKGMMEREGVTEERLNTQGTIPTSFGEELSWEYLSYVRTHPVDWTAETHVLYGENDCLVPSSSLKAFLSGCNATLTVMGGGEHWFHTPEQTAFVAEWINGIKDKETK